MTIGDIVWTPLGLFKLLKKSQGSMAKAGNNKWYDIWLCQPVRKNGEQDPRRLKNRLIGECDMTPWTG